MKMEIEPLRTSSLIHLEASQLIERHLIDMGVLDPTKITDASLKWYTANLKTKSDAFGKSLVPIRKSELTIKIDAADNERDTAITALGKAINLLHSSDIPAEVEAGYSLQIVLDTYKNLATL